MSRAVAAEVRAGCGAAAPWRRRGLVIPRLAGSGEGWAGSGEGGRRRECREAGGRVSEVSGTAELDGVVQPLPGARDGRRRVLGQHLPGADLAERLLNMARTCRGRVPSGRWPGALIGGEASILSSRVANCCAAAAASRRATSSARFRCAVASDAASAAMLSLSRSILRQRRLWSKGWRRRETSALMLA